MIKVRFGVFETNSSSVHSLTMCSDQEYNDWKSGKLLYHRYDEKLVPASNYTEEQLEEESGELLSYLNFEALEYETFNVRHVTPSGETVWAFGYYGSDY